MRPISIHALLAESDRSRLLLSLVLGLFLSTLSLRRATHDTRRYDMRDTYFYPRSPCGERLTFRQSCGRIPVFLSTLSLRRATRHGSCRRRLSEYFYPRSPCGERPSNIAYCTHSTPFLSTLSLRRATHRTDAKSPQQGDFYPRSPCGERHVLLVDEYAPHPISIHALLAESDSKSAQNSGALLRI